MPQSATTASDQILSLGRLRGGRTFVGITGPADAPPFVLFARRGREIADVGSQRPGAIRACWTFAVELGSAPAGGAWHPALDPRRFRPLRS
jgi:hypothetical protein